MCHFGKFPPKTMNVCGWPLQLWEALIANIDAKSLLYALCHGGTYNVRAFSSMMGETFFSELTLNDKRGHGTVASKNCGQFIGTTVEKVQMRLDPERTFTIRTARKTAYKLVDETEPILRPDDMPCVVCNGNQFVIQHISPRDHMFDNAGRKRLKGRKKEAVISQTRNAVEKGTLGVRWEKARRNDSKLLPTSRMGIDDIS